MFPDGKVVADVTLPGLPGTQARIHPIPSSPIPIPTPNYLDAASPAATRLTSSVAASSGLDPVVARPTPWRSPSPRRSSAAAAATTTTATLIAPGFRFRPNQVSASFCFRGIIRACIWTKKLRSTTSPGSSTTATTTTRAVPTQLAVATVVHGPAGECGMVMERAAPST